MTRQGRNWALAFLVGGAFLSVGPVPGTGTWRIGPGAFQEAKEVKKAVKPPALAERFRKWLSEEVVYIVSENERDVFRSLRTDAERDNFIKMFWKRRDPTPETPVNEFREEHYRRIAFANDTYFEGKAGWRSDRGRVYIMFGPPDFFETNPGGGRGFLFGAQAPTAEFPSEVWTYREIPGLKIQDSRVDFTFVNYYAAGSYQLTDNPALANALRNVSLPARYAGYNDYPSDIKSPTVMGQMSQNAFKQPLQQLAMMAELTKSRGDVLEELERSSRQRKLKGIVESKASLSGLTISSKENYLRGADGLTYVPMVLEVAAKDLEFRPAKDRYQGLVNFYIEVKDESGPIFQKSDRLEMDLKEDSYRRRFAENYQYLQGASLKPGRYFLHLVVWDEQSGKVGYTDRWIDVPNLTSDEFGASDIILARDIRRIEGKPEEVTIETKDLPAMRTLRNTDLKVPDKMNMARPRGGPYTFGDLDVSPSMTSQYSGTDELAYFYQVYNATFDEDLGVARLRIEERILKGDQPAVEIGEPRDIQVPIAQKSKGGIDRGNRFRLSSLVPGKYELVVRVRDIFSGKTSEKRAAFEVK
jgi:GWxTD domain-containing protein